MTAYCDRQGSQRGAIRFVFDGNTVGEEQTPLDVRIMHIIKKGISPSLRP